MPLQFQVPPTSSKSLSSSWNGYKKGRGSSASSSPQREILACTHHTRRRLSGEEDQREGPRWRSRARACMQASVFSSSCLAGSRGSELARLCTARVLLLHHGLSRFGVVIDQSYATASLPVCVQCPSRHGLSDLKVCDIDG